MLLKKAMNETIHHRILKADLLSVSSDQMRSALCQNCGAKANFMTSCGHYVHPVCLIEKRICVPDCGRRIKKLELFWDILKDAEMDQSKEYYKEISGCSNWRKGLIKWLIYNDKEGWAFLKIQERYKHFFDADSFKIFRKIVLEQSLLANDLRIAKYSSIYGPVVIDKSVLNIVWKRDHKEALAIAYNLNMIDIKRKTYNLTRDPLMVACITGNLDLLKRVVGTKVNLNRKANVTFPFQFACESEAFADQVEFFDLLMAHGAHFVDPVSYGEFWCPFEKAVRDNNTRLVQYFILKGIKPISDVMSSAIANSFVEMVKILHEGGIEFIDGWPAYQCVTSLRSACNVGSLEIVKFIIESRARFKGDRESINTAIDCSNFDILELLLSSGVQPDNNHIIKACSSGNFEMVRLLIEYGADPDPSGFRSFGRLLMGFDFESLEDEEKVLEIIEYFLRLGVDIDVKDFNDETLLYKFCQSDKNLPIIKKLVDFGANINRTVRSNGSLTAFTKACRSGCPNIARHLLRNGANLKEPDGLNCYLNSIRPGNLELVKIMWDCAIKIR